jgi:hypothetical protein
MTDPDILLHHASGQRNPPEPKIKFRVEKPNLFNNFKKKTHLRSLFFKLKVKVKKYLI